MVYLIKTRRILPIISTIFRLFVYGFLRVIPARLGIPILPTLYFLYLGLIVLTWRSGPSLSKYSTIKYSTRKISQILALSLHTRSKALRLCNLAINTVLFLLAVDFTLSPALKPANDTVFSRVGAIQSDSVRVIVRYPLENEKNGSVTVKYRSYAESSGKDERWLNGPTIQLHEEDDWIGATTLTNLWPSTSYEYMLANLTLDKLPYPSTPLTFKTFPDPRLQGGSHFRFVASSCLTHNFPYAPGYGSRIKGFDLLADQLWPSPVAVPRTESIATSESSVPIDNHDNTSRESISVQEAMERSPPAPRAIWQPENEPSDSMVETAFLLLLGDFVYADVPYYFGDRMEAYRRLYRRTYASPSMRRIYERLPVYNIYDDHEIKNNFVGLSNTSTPPYANAANAYHLYNARGNYNSTKTDAYYYNFRYGDSAFFIMDTRRYRSDPSIRTEDSGTRTMLGEAQLSSLHSWLAEVNETASFKFVVTSVPFTSLWQHDAKWDSWTGYPEERQSLLSAFHSVPNIILLSGDRHEFAAIEYNGPTAWSHTVLEFSTSPLSMFYVPFIRTLKMESREFVEKTSLVSGSMNGTAVWLSEVALVPAERVLRYIPVGNYKWSSFEVDTRNPKEPILRVDLTVDGRHKYYLNITGSPVSLRKSTALGALIPHTVHGILDKIGFTPSKWF